MKMGVGGGGFSERKLRKKKRERKEKRKEERGRRKKKRGEDLFTLVLSKYIHERLRNCRKRNVVKQGSLFFYCIIFTTGFLVTFLLFFNFFFENRRLALKTIWV